MTSAGRWGVPGCEPTFSVAGCKFVEGGERLPWSRGGDIEFMGAVVLGGTCCCCVGDKLVVFLTMLALLLFVVVAGGCGSSGVSFVLVSIASAARLGTRIELRGEDIAGALFSMLFALLLLLISPFVVPIKFSVECLRLPGAVSVLRLPFEGLCSMLFIVDDRDGPGGVSVPFWPLTVALAGCVGRDHCVVLVTWFT